MILSAAAACLFITRYRHPRSPAGYASLLVAGIEMNERQVRAPFDPEVEPTNRPHLRRTMRSMKRVVIFGRGASGKSTLAKRLGEITGLPVVELDEIFWQPGLLATPVSYTHLGLCVALPKQFWVRPCLFGVGPCRSSKELLTE